ncbi:MAG TPA: lipoprotein [Bauldia sp.]|nr:lipoprotein [Bauldia sp.]
MALTDRPILYKAAVCGLVLAALTLSACGRKGPLEPPPGAAVTKPDPSDPATADPTVKKPDRHFVLDPLL